MPANAMAADDRPRRSLLYMPGSNPRALEKGRGLPADGLILDLEDAVAPDAKATARDVVLSALRAGGYGRRELVVRVNALSTSWGQADLVAVARSRAHAVLLPKVEETRELFAALARDDLGAYLQAHPDVAQLRAPDQVR